VCSALERPDPIPLPATQDSRNQTTLISEEGRFPDVAERKAMTNIKNGVPTIKAGLSLVRRKPVARGGAIRGRTDALPGGITISAGIYPLIGSLLHPAGSDMGDTMMLSLYVTLGIFLLVAVRKPSVHRSVIAFAAWSSFAHAVAMSTLGLEIPSQRTGFLIGSAVLVVIGVTLIVLAPAKQSVGRESAAIG
jgi:hypothetical protein